MKEDRIQQGKRWKGVNSFVTNSEVYKKLGETKWLGRSMLGTALALVGRANEYSQDLVCIPLRKNCT